MDVRVNNPGGGGSVTASDDGTNITISFSGTTLFKYRKSDGYLLLDAAVIDDAF